MNSYIFNVPYEDWVALDKGEYDHQLYLKWKMGKEVHQKDTVIFYPKKEVFKSSGLKNLKFWGNWFKIQPKEINKYPKDNFCLKFQDGIKT